MRRTPSTFLLIVLLVSAAACASEDPGPAEATGPTATGISGSPPASPSVGASLEDGRYVGFDVDGPDEPGVCCDRTFVGELGTFATAVNGGELVTEGDLVYYGSQSQYWATVQGGVLTGIEEQYLP